MKALIFIAITMLCSCGSYQVCDSFEKHDPVVLIEDLAMEPSPQVYTVEHYFHVRWPEPQESPMPQCALFLLDSLGQNYRFVAEDKVYKIQKQ